MLTAIQSYQEILKMRKLGAKYLYHTDCNLDLHHKVYRYLMDYSIEEQLDYVLLLEALNVNYSEGNHNYYVLFLEDKIHISNCKGIQNLLETECMPYDMEAENEAIAKFTPIKTWDVDSKADEIEPSMERIRVVFNEIYSNPKYKK